MGILHLIDFPYYRHNSYTGSLIYLVLPFLGYHPHLYLLSYKKGQQLTDIGPSVHTHTVSNIIIIPILALSQLIDTIVAFTSRR
jgi:hypothetical protein